MTLTSFTLPDEYKSRRISLLGCSMDALSMEETISLIDSAIAQRQSLQHVVVNAAKLVHSQQDVGLRVDIKDSDLINIDGMGVVWGARLMGHHVPQRVAGIDIMTHMLELCAKKNYRPYILGAKPEILDKALQNIKESYPNIEIAGAHHGYYAREEEVSLMQSIRDTKADCLFIAISSPHKERIMGEYKEMLEIPFVMGVGGSVDVLAGHVQRAPLWMQKAGLEWFYRLAQEPQRMWKRYLVTNTKFIGLLLRERCGLVAF